jgi:cytochrome c-type biogenesis protein CcsB
MTNEMLAQYANLSLYSAMGVFTLAMICYALYLAGLVPHRDRGAARQDELVAAGSAPALPHGEATPGMPGGGADGDETPLRARKAAGIASSMTWLGGFLLQVSAVLRGASVHRWPLGNMFEFAVVACMFTVLAFCAWSTRRDLRWLGLFVVAPVLLVLGMAVTVWYTEAAELLPSLKSYWLVIHVTVATLSVAVFTLAAAATALYLAKDALARAGKTSFLDRFPDTPVLERLAYGLHIVAFPMWTFTLIAGAIWARQAWGSYWNWDPKEVWTFVIWVVYAAYLHARATSGWSRQSANAIALAGYACILINYGVVNVFFVGQHSYSGL